MIGRGWSAAPGLGVLVLAASCASTQQVSLECVPSEVQIFVDGRELEKPRAELKLGVDEPHTLYFKGGSYRPQMVVLEAQEVDGKRVLSNADLCQRLVFTPVSPEVRMHLDPDDLPPE
jgi:hypothetical protein